MIDMVDIGGAAKHGRPTLPPVQTVDFQDDRVVAVSDDGKTIVDHGDAPDGRIVQRVTEEVSAKVAMAAVGRQVAYPSSHPANRDDLKQEQNGALHPTNSQTVSPSPEALGDVRQGYVSGNLSKPSLSPAQIDNLRNDRPMGGLGYLAPVEGESAPLSAKDPVGTPVIEVCYETPIGIVVSYYHRVVQAKSYLILITDNRFPAQQRFILKPPIPGSESLSTPAVITGKDRNSTKLAVIALGIDFTVDNYDFSVLMIESEG